MKNVAELTEDGAFALFFVPTPGDLTAQDQSPTPGICHPRQKNANARKSTRGGGRVALYRHDGMER